MNLISCDHCGVVLDANKLGFDDDDLRLYDGSIDDSKAVWDSELEDYVPYVECPVCENPVTK